MKNTKITTWEDVPSDFDYSKKEIERLLKGFDDFYFFINSVTFNNNPKMDIVRKSLEKACEDYQMNIVSAIKKSY